MSGSPRDRDNRNRSAASTSTSTSSQPSQSSTIHSHSLGEEVFERNREFLGKIGIQLNTFAYALFTGGSFNHDPQFVVNSVEIPFVSGSQNKCFYISVSNALGILIQQVEALLDHAIYIIKTIKQNSDDSKQDSDVSMSGILFNMAELMDDPTNSQVDDIISTYTSKTDWIKKTNGGAIEMMMLSMLTDGRLEFIQHDYRGSKKRIGYLLQGYTEEQMNERSYKIHLAHCNYTGSHGGTLNHYQLFEFKATDGRNIKYVPPGQSFNDELAVSAYINSLKDLANQSWKRNNGVNRDQSPSELNQKNKEYFDEYLKKLENRFPVTTSELLSFKLSFFKKMQEIIQVRNQRLSKDQGICNIDGNFTGNAEFRSFLFLCGFVWTESKETYVYNESLVSENCITHYSQKINAKIQELQAQVSNRSHNPSDPSQILRSFSAAPQSNVCLPHTLFFMLTLL